MKSIEFDLGSLAEVCATNDPDAGHQALLEAMRPLLKGLPFEHVTGRGGWYRLGGVVDGLGGRIAEDLAEWVNSECGGDVDAVVADFRDSGYRITKRAGETHYFTAQTGPAPEDFVQLEVEELRELVDRPLVDPAALPEDLEEFLDPVEYTRLDPQPIGPARYLFRRITPVAPLLHEMAKTGDGAVGLHRFLREWAESSAHELPFCEHWVLMMRRHTGRSGELRTSAKPTPTYVGKPPKLEADPELRGIDLANRINAFDREIGYPFAWYFFMLTSRAVPHEFAQQIHAELMGAYDYLPARDLKILRRWSEQPYGV